MVLLINEPVFAAKAIRRIGRRQRDIRFDVKYIQLEMKKGNRAKVFVHVNEIGKKIKSIFQITERIIKQF